MYDLCKHLQAGSCLIFGQIPAPELSNWWVAYKKNKKRVAFFSFVMVIKQELRIVHRGRLQMMDLLNSRVLQFTLGLCFDVNCVRANWAGGLQLEDCKEDRKFDQ